MYGGKERKKGKTDPVVCQQQPSYLIGRRKRGEKSPHMAETEREEKDAGRVRRSVARHFAAAKEKEGGKEKRGLRAGLMRTIQCGRLHD